jgi:hypothetical protein
MRLRFGSLAALALALAASAQAPPAAVEPINVNTDALPAMTVGIGPSWTRGDVHAASADVDVAFRLGNTNAYSWSTISTPVATVPAGSQPLASTVTTGAGYVIAQSAGGAVSFVAIGQAGINQVQATSTTSLAVTGSAALALRLGKTNLYVMPYMKASNPQKGTDGALVSAILQPGIMLVYGFGRK